MITVKLNAATLPAVLGGSRGFAPEGLALVEQLFDHLPDAVFFAKDAQGRYVAVNQTLVRRCGRRAKQELLGRAVGDFFPPDLAARCAAQDERVLRLGRHLLDHLEMHWQEHRRPGWCLTTKLPVRNGAGQIIGLLGVSRDLRVPGGRLNIPAGLLAALEHLETHYADAVSPSSLARRAGLTSARFARLVKRIFQLTPQQLIVQTRLAAAARLLTETDRSLAQTALECGFYDHSAFTRAFRAATDLTPSKFREARRY
jgi:PAS domain S-box-containing protein